MKRRTFKSPLADPKYAELHVPIDEKRTIVVSYKPTLNGLKEALRQYVRAFQMEADFSRELAKWLRDVTFPPTCPKCGANDPRSFKRLNCTGGYHSWECSMCKLKFEIKRLR